MRLYRFTAVFVICSIIVTLSPAFAADQKPTSEDAGVLLDEDFSQYFGGEVSGAGNSQGNAQEVSDFQGTSFQWKNPYVSDSGEVESQLCDRLTYNFDTALSSGKYILSFDLMLDNVPDTEAGETGRLFMCRLGKASGGYDMGQTFMVGDGYIGYCPGMESWGAYNDSRIKYEKNKWYSVSMVLNIGDNNTIDYYINGAYIGNDSIIEKIMYPISRIEFALEDRQSKGSLYIDNIKLTKGMQCRKTKIISEIEAGDKQIDIRLPFDIKPDSGIGKNEISIVSVESGENLSISSTEMLDAGVCRIHFQNGIEAGSYKCIINSEAKDFLDNQSLKNTELNFEAYGSGDISDRFDLGSTYADFSKENQVSMGMRAYSVNGQDAEKVKCNGINGWRLTPSKDKHSILFDVTDDELTNISDGSDVELRVVYFDSGQGEISLFYDSQYLSKESGGKIKFDNTNKWKEKTVVLKAPKFNGGIEYESNSYDFMVGTYSYADGYLKNSCVIAAVSVKKIKSGVPVKISADSGRTGNIFYTGDEISFDIKLFDMGQTKKTYQKTISVTDKNGNVCYTKTDNAEFVSSPVIKEKVIFPPNKYGVYTLNIKLIDGGGIAERSYEFSYVNSGRGEILNDNLGICMHYSLGDHMNWNNSSETVLDLFSNAGIGWVRDNVDIANYVVKNNDGTYTRKIPAVLSEYISEITTRKMKFMPILEGGLFTDEYPLYTDEAQKTFAEYAAYYAKDLEAMGVNCFELWNEYNNDAFNIPPKSYWQDDAYYEKAKYYVNFLDYVYTAVKKSSPDFKIIGGAISNIPLVWINNMFKGIKEKNKGPLMDVLSIHPYIPNPSVSTLVDRIEEIDESAYELENYPIWATEFGWSTSGADAASPERQAQIITSYYILANTHKTFDKMFIYSWRDNDTDKGEVESQYGILKANRGDLLDVPCAAKPAYLAVSNMNIQIGDAVSSEVISDEESKNLYKYTKKNGDMVYAAWGSGKLCYDFKSPRIIIADIYGNETVSESESGKYEIELSGDVSYIKVPKYNIPTYTVNRESKTARINLGADSGVSEENKPTISTSDGNSVNYELKRDGEAYYAEVSSENNYTVIWTENGYINRFKAAPADKKSQFTDSASAYCIGINSAEGKVKFSGVSDSKNAELCTAAFFPSQKKSVSPSNGIPAWYDNALTDEYGRYSASFKTEITPGTYALTLSSDSKIETEVMFELKQDIETSLKQGKKLVRDVKDIDAAEPVSVSAYFKNPNEYKNAVLILAVKADNQLKYTEYRTVSECVDVGGGNYRFNVDGSVFKGADGTQVLLWEDLKTLSPLKEIMK